VAITTMATILLELSLTRIFSAVFYYHFAFLAISIALFGLGVGGVLSYVVAGWKAQVFAKLGWLSAIDGMLVVLALAVVPAQKSLDLTNRELALIYFTNALPFVVAGMILSLAISHTVERVDRVYFFDLLGAAAGCLVLVPLLNYLGGPGAVLASAVLFAAAAAIWHRMAGSTIAPVVGVALALGLVVFLVVNNTKNVIGVKRQPDETFVQWNSFSRIALLGGKDPDSWMIVIDGDANTSIAHVDPWWFSQPEPGKLINTGAGLAYVLRPRSKTLVIGPGGGWDVAAALASGSRDVTGVEINPIIATTIMRRKFPQLSLGLYLRPEVHIAVEDGRSFVRRSKVKYGVLTATLVDTWASTAAGAFALSENNLYTSDAFRDYLEHLTDDGILAVTRWGFEPPRESLRLVSLAIDALRRMGRTEPWRHVIAVRRGDAKEVGALDSILVSPSPFTPEDMRKTEDFIREMKMEEALYLPDKDTANPFNRLLRSSNPQDYQRAYPFDISPVSDNRPFFFYTVQPRDLWNFLAIRSTNIDHKINRAVPLVIGLAAVSIVATIVVLLLPPLVLRTRLPPRKGVLTFLLYFLFIGAGYILIEVALIQKFVLFLGHPTYALTVVIFSMLVSSGLGSYFSRRVLGGDIRRWIQALALVALLTAVLALAVSYLLTPAVGLRLWLKVAMTVLLIAPAGFMMGMPFPTGLARLETWHKPSVRWAWSLNAASSVLGSVGALLCAIYFGLLQTLLIGGGLYLGAMLMVVLRRNDLKPVSLDTAAYLSMRDLDNFKKDLDERRKRTEKKDPPPIANSGPS
jgi:hypothetical protein